MEFCVQKSGNLAELWWGTLIWLLFSMKEDYRELFPASSIVYLCAESKYELPDTFLSASKCTDATVENLTDGSATTAIENSSSATDAAIPVFTTDDIYVIGGLVDHNHHQGLCYQQVSSLIRHLIPFNEFWYCSRSILNEWHTVVIQCPELLLMLCKGCRI